MPMQGTQLYKSVITGRRAIRKIQSNLALLKHLKEEKNAEKNLIKFTIQGLGPLKA